MTSLRRFSIALAAAGTAKQEVETVLSAPAELSDDQLATVVGGTKKSVRDKNSNREFLIIIMNDVIITSVVISVLTAGDCSSSRSLLPEST